MKVQTLPLEQTGHFLPIFIHYLQENPQLRPFYGLAPKAESFAEQLQEKKFSPEKRELLLEVLQAQYKGFDLPQPVAENLQALAHNDAFTITTGHQLNIFTGPLYFIYKITATIKACRELQELHPDRRFVPVYWMASEDHDLAEINHFSLFGRDYRCRVVSTSTVSVSTVVSTSTVVLSTS